MNPDIIIVGAGAAGLMAAGTAASAGAKVLLLERNEKPARKVMITGKGRCNVTNACNSLDELIGNVPVNGRFLYGAFSRFMPGDTVDFFENRGVMLKKERGNRVFPASDKAVDIVDSLTGFAVNSGVRIQRGRVTALLTGNGKAAGVVTEDGTEYRAGRVIIATGGASYPLTGSTGDGYALAESVGHTVVPVKPSLVPLECHEGFCSELQGLSLRNVTLTATDTKTNKEIYKELGEMLFTHFGVSGPLVLSASSHMREMSKGRYKLIIDLKPGLTEEQLDARVLRDFNENVNRNFINALNGLLPKKLVPVVVRLSGVPMSTKVNQVTKEQRRRLVELLKNFTVTVTDYRPVEEAIITSGGVKVSELDPKTMESKLVGGLYFAGEVIDVDAYTGGFNLQIAFSTGRLAAQSAVSSLKNSQDNLTGR